MRFIGKALVAILAAFGVLALIVVGGIWAVIHALGSLGGAEAVYAQSDRFVLAIDLDQELPEADDQPWMKALDHPTLTLQRAIQAIDAAATDPHVTGLRATLSDAPLSMAATQELRDAITRFRASGKPTQVFAPTIGEGGGGTHSYYLATAFDSIWLQPSGDVGLSGFGLEMPFFQKALSELGISTELAKRWEYKNAMDGAARETMSEPHRMSMLRLLESWRSQVISGVATHTNQDPETVGQILDGPPLNAQEALASKLIDNVGYRDQASDAFAAQTDSEDELKLEDYAAAQDARRAEHASTIARLPKIALIQVSGLIARTETAPGQATNSDEIAEAVHDAVNDPDVRAIVLRIDSPGGSYVASDTIWRELKLAREADLPVIVSMGDMAASGGYFIAIPGSKIVALPGTLTGSIGVYAFKPVLQGMWSKIHVNWETVALGEYATMWSSNHAFTEAQRAQFEKGVDSAYRDFTAKVAEGRHLSPEVVDKVARGRIWTGQDALEVGLVDALGGQYEAVRLAKQEVGLDPEAPINLTTFPEEPSPVEALLGELNLRNLSTMMSAFAQVSSAAKPFTSLMSHAEVASKGPALLGPPMGDAKP